MLVRVAHRLGTGQRDRGLVADRDGRRFSVLGFAISGGTIDEIDMLADPERRRIDLTVLTD